MFQAVTTPDGGMKAWAGFVPKAERQRRRIAAARKKRHKTGKYRYYVRDRDDARIKRFTKRILRRDGYKCVKCESDKELAVHHIQLWAQAPLKRLDPKNAVTLCGHCHAQVHDWMPQNEGLEHLRAIQKSV